MAQQTAVEWLIEQLTEVDYGCINKTFLQNNNSLAGHKLRELFEQAKEMEKQQIIDAAERWKGTDFAEKYYAETYGSKGKNDKINLVEIPQEQLEQERNPAYKYFDIDETKGSELATFKESSQTEISDEELKYIIENDNSTFKVCYVCGMEKCVCEDDDLTDYEWVIKELKKERVEISDEELEKLAELEYSYDELASTELKGLIVSAERAAWIDGIKWYREQLKKKENEKI